MRVTGAKSAIGSYGGVRYRNWFIVSVESIAINIV